MPEEREDDVIVVHVDRGAPLVATGARAAAIALIGAAIVVGLAYAYVTFTHGARTLASLWPWIAVGCVSLAVVSFALLRSEESRLARELRTARTGTPLIRDMVLRRRQQLPVFLRVLTTTYGTAAVLVAEGDRSAALDHLAAASPLMRVGRIRALRELVEADAERASESLAGLSRCIERVRAMAPIGNVEADRYRVHVLVKAVLQQGDAEIADALIEEIAQSKDDEVRPYGVWLRAWFDLDEGRPAPTEGELRMAALLARTHGAADLQKKLDERIAALAKKDEPPASP